MAILGLRIDRAVCPVTVLGAPLSWLINIDGQGPGDAMATSFDEHERSRWAGRATAYERSFGALFAYPADHLLDAAGVGAGCRVLDVGTGPGTVAARAVGRGAVVVAVDAEPSRACWTRFVGASQQPT